MEQVVQKCGILTFPEPAHESREGKKGILFSVPTTSIIVFSFIEWLFPGDIFSKGRLFFYPNHI